MDDKLAKLKKEFEKGQQQMALLDQRRQELRDTMLRISGAIQMLEELQSPAPVASGAEQPVSSAAA